MKRLQVFLSSTYTDMLEERQAAVQAILQAGHIPAGMELFAAGDASQMQIIRRWIDDSDVFVLLVGGRYGSIEDETKKSYIHLEWEYATEKGKPRLAFLPTDGHTKAKLAKAGADAGSFVEQQNGAKFAEFKKVFDTRMCAMYSSTDKLQLGILTALSEQVRNPDLTGWVRGSDTVNLKETIDHFNRLQAENEQLREENQLLTALQQEASELTPEEIAASLTVVQQEFLLVAVRETGGITWSHQRGIESGGTTLLYGKTANDPVARLREIRRQEAETAEMVQALENRGLITVERRDRNTECHLTLPGFRVGELLQTKVVTPRGG